MSCTGEPLSPFMCPLSALSSLLATDLGLLSAFWLKRIDAPILYVLISSTACAAVLTNSSCCFIAWDYLLLYAKWLVALRQSFIVIGIHVFCVGMS